MDNTSTFEYLCYRFYGLFDPYKHKTAYDVDQDADIENQYEKVAIKTVVLSGNLFTNLLVWKVELIKVIGQMTKVYIREIMEYYNKSPVEEGESEGEMEYEVVPDKKND